MWRQVPPTKHGMLDSSRIQPKKNAGALEPILPQNFRNHGEKVPSGSFEDPWLFVADAQPFSCWDLNGFLSVADEDSSGMLRTQTPRFCVSEDFENSHHVSGYKMVQVQFQSDSVNAKKNNSRNSCYKPFPKLCAIGFTTLCISSSHRSSKVDTF